MSPLYVVASQSNANKELILCNLMKSCPDIHRISNGCSKINSIVLNGWSQT